MARDRVVKTEILCHSTRKDDVLTVLEDTGRIHLIDISGLEESPFMPLAGEEDPELARLGSSLARAIPFLRDRTGKKNRTEAVLSVKQLQNFLANDELRKSAVRAANIADELVELEANEQEIQRKTRFLKQWQDLPVEFSQINREGLYSLRAGAVSPADGFAPLEELQKDQPLFHYVKISDTRVLAMWHTDVEAEVLNALTEAGFASEDFSGFQDNPTRELAKLDQEQKANHSRKEALQKEVCDLAESLPNLEALSDAVGLAGFRSSSAASGRKSSKAVLLHAWVKDSHIPGLRDALENLGEVEIQEIEPLENEAPPVQLSENATADPYLMLTDMYGRPQGADPDPTPHMAPFYAMFFGICIGDAGYGLALAAGAAAGWYFTGKRQGNTRLFRLLFQGGLASIFWGVILGGWFGMAHDKLPALLQAAAKPLNDLVPPGEIFSLSNQFLYLTLVFGVIQLAWGVVVNLQKRLRQGEGFAALVDQTGWMLSLLGLFPWLFDHYLFNIYDNSGVIDSILLGMLGAGALLIFIMGGREAGNLGGKVGLGAYACYGIVNLLGDVLSYSRLFALALSSAIIASVINDIAGMLRGSVPVVGILLAVLVLAAGHLFNLAMAVLSGFIHTARLQFVEFFGKFYDGTGVPFTPLRYEPKYVRIER